MSGVTLLCLICFLACVQKSSQKFSTGRLSLEDYKFLQSLPKPRATSILPGFKYLYVNNAGQLSYNLDPSQYQVEIAGSPGTTWEAIRAAAEYVIKMTRYMPAHIFANLATRASLGVFSAAEKLVVFPEYAHLANTFCGTSCSGNCAQTCTFDGRKYEDVAGVGGQRAVILDDNILCTPRDPYNGRENILAHEFTHTIHQYALTDSDKANIHAAYNAARAHQTWTLSSYAMQNDMEYFAEAATVYFGVNSYNIANTGGMNICHPSQFCSDETDGRYHLWQVDLALYSVLTIVFTDNRPSLLSGLTVCPASYTVVG